MDTTSTPTDPDIDDVGPPAPDTELTEEQKKVLRERDKHPRVRPGTPDPRVRMTTDDRIKTPR